MTHTVLQAKFSKVGMKWKKIKKCERIIIKKTHKEDHQLYVVLSSVVRRTTSKNPIFYIEVVIFRRGKKHINHYSTFIISMNLPNSCCSYLNNQSAQSEGGCVVLQPCFPEITFDHSFLCVCTEDRVVFLSMNSTIFIHFEFLSFVFFVLTDSKPYVP